MTARALALMVLVAACGRGPSAPGSGPDVAGEARIAIDWDPARVVDWGAPESLRARVDGAPAGATVVWRSLDDRYLGAPVELGTGPAITTAALKPGTTTVEAAVVAGGATRARAAAEVEVRYRPSWNVALEGHLPYPEGTVGDVWMLGRHALVARRAAGGISVVDVDGPREVGRFTRHGLFTQDVKARDGIAFVSHEGPTYPNSVTILDVTDPAAPREIAAIPRSETPTAHNLWLDGSTLYVAAPFGTRAIHAYDVTDPARPRPLGRMNSTAGNAHDVHARDGRVFGSYLPLDKGTIGELVVAAGGGALAPVSFTTYDGAFIHSSWLAADGRHLYVADEVLNAPIRIFDVSDPGHPRLVGRYRPRLGTVPHNFQLGAASIAYLAHYKHGVEVIDVSNPAAPRLVGFYDTKAGIDADVEGSVPGQPLASALALTRDVCERHCLSLAHGAGASLFEGAWGVHWTVDGRIVVSDMTSGLYVLRFTP